MRRSFLLLVLTSCLKTSFPVQKREKGLPAVIATIAAVGSLVQATQGCKATFEMDKKDGQKIKLTLNTDSEKEKPKNSKKK